MAAFGVENDLAAPDLPVTTGPRIPTHRGEDVMARRGKENRRPDALVVAVDVQMCNLAQCFDGAHQGRIVRPEEKLGEVVTKLRNKGFTIVLVEQNFRFAAGLADRHYVVEGGLIVEVVERSELKAKAELLNGYLGV